MLHYEVQVTLTIATIGLMLFEGCVGFLQICVSFRNKDWLAFLTGKELLLMVTLYALKAGSCIFANILHPIVKPIVLLKSLSLKKLLFSSRFELPLRQDNRLAT